MDATIIEVPIQRNTKEENAQIKNDEVPEDWKNNQSKFSQKDTDARWTKKHGKSYYGYKNHIIADASTKLIRKYIVTSASVHDSQIGPELAEDLHEKEDCFADSAYNAPEIEVEVRSRKANPLFCKKGKRNHPLTDEEKEWNRSVSKIRARVEHVFGDMKSFAADRIRSIGIKRAKMQIFLGNFVYNLRRTCFLLRARSV